MGGDRRLRAWRIGAVLALGGLLGTGCARATATPTTSAETEASASPGAAGDLAPDDELAGVTFAEDLNVVLLAMTRLPVGLYYRDVEVGTGVPASPGREIAITYLAYLPDGREVDRTPPAGPPLRFVLGNGTVIRGWDLGIRGMKVGGTRQLVVPARLAYGRRAIGQVPANATLVFLVRLDKVG